MFTKRNFLLFAAAMAVIGLGAFAVSAQDTTTPTQPPFGMMGQQHDMMGQHGMMNSDNQMWDGDSAPMFMAVAQALGIDQQVLVSELQSGKTLTQLAQEKGVDLAAVTATTQATMQQHIDELVTAGTLTQAQADARLSLMQSHWYEMPMFNGTGYGLMMGGMGQGGMWGNSDAAPRGRMGRGG